MKAYESRSEKRITKTDKKMLQNLYTLIDDLSITMILEIVLILDQDLYSCLDLRLGRRFESFFRRKILFGNFFQINNNAVNAKSAVFDNCQNI